MKKFANRQPRSILRKKLAKGLSRTTDGLTAKQAAEVIDTCETTARYVLADMVRRGEAVHYAPTDLFGFSDRKARWFSPDKVPAEAQ